MDLRKALEEISEKRAKVTSAEYHQMRAFFSRLLKLHAGGEISLESAVDDLVSIAEALEVGDTATLRNTIFAPEDIISRSENHPSGRLQHEENWPSKTGNPSGGRRTNAVPDRKQKAAD